MIQRVDVLQSSRHVRVEFNGQEIANTTKPRLLFETSLRTRTYIPMTDCRLDLLVPSKTTSECPYKVRASAVVLDRDSLSMLQGVANYYTIRLPDGTKSEDSVWWYRTPQAECIEIKGFLAFYDEKLDVFVDGVLQKR